MNHLVAQLQGLSKVYRSPKSDLAVHALQEVDLDIPRGQYMAIMGPSGSGKSTLMNLLGCLDRPTGGRYLLESQDVAQLNDDDLSRIRREQLGFVFQAFNLISQLSVLQNVMVPLFYQGVHRHERARQAEAAIARVGLTDRQHHRPSELSGGQQQRVAIARALVNKPRLLFADEPTGNLDSATGKSILNLFDELHQQGMTLIMVTHDEAIADRCQRIIRLLDGRINSDTES